MPRLRRFDRCEPVRLELPSGAAVELHVAETFTTRLLGLAGLVEPPARGLLIPRCRSVHTIGMRFPIDIVFIGWPPSSTGHVRVLELHEQIPPGRVARLGGGRCSRRRVAAAEVASATAKLPGLRTGMEDMVALVREGFAPL